MHRLRQPRFAALIVSVLICGTAPAQKYTLAGTYIDAGYFNSGQLIPAGQTTAVGPVVEVECSGAASSCTVQADHFIQVGHGNTAQNQATIGFLLDGSLVEDNQIAGSTPSDGTYTILAASERQTGVSPGTHTVQILLYSVADTFVFNYNTNFRVYIESAAAGPRLRDPHEERDATSVISPR